MEVAQNNNPDRSERWLSWRRLLVAGLVAAVGASVANTVIYFIGAALRFVPQDVAVSPDGAPLGIGIVIIASVVGAIGAAAVLAVLNLFLRRPVRVFYVISAVVLLLSFYTPTTISGAPVAMVLTLGLMHVVAAAVIMGALTTLARRG